MEPRRIADLAQLPDAELFEEVARGLVMIHENATRIWESVALLAANCQFRSAEILKLISLEEAAKYLILLDAIRCPRQTDAKLFSNQLRKFNEHLARGLYANACDWRPINLQELGTRITRECEAYYLDGPNDVDWIFRNDIKREREEALYVDYVDYEGAHEWVSPKTRENISAQMFFREPIALRLVRALNEAGFGKPESIAIIAQVWRANEFTDDSDQAEIRSIARDTLLAMGRRGLLGSRNENICHFIVERWPFPLYRFPMKIVEVEKAKLREIQSQWHPNV